MSEYLQEFVMFCQTQAGKHLIAIVLFIVVCGLLYNGKDQQPKDKL